MSLFIAPPARPPKDYSSEDESQYRLGVYQALKGIPMLVGTAVVIPVRAPQAGDPPLQLVTVGGVNSLYLWTGSVWRAL